MQERGAGEYNRSLPCVVVCEAQYVTHHGVTIKQTGTEIKMKLRNAASLLGQIRSLCPKYLC